MGAASTVNSAGGLWLFARDPLGQVSEAAPLGPQIQTATVSGPTLGSLTVSVAASMAHIASAFPTAGGLYHWGSILGGRGCGWATAWFNLAGLVTGASFKVVGKSLFKDEFVTCGGVRLSEVDFRTMESRVCPGLHFAGEVLDIDGVTGGFNFQAAWTTGWLAGQAMAEGATGCAPPGMRVGSLLRPR